MLIDPFTVIVQIINFAVLLVALKFVLFDRIVRHMDERQQRLAQQREESEERLAEAAEKGRELDRRLAEFDREREDLMAEAREHARQRRQELIEEARREVEAQRDRWSQALEDEQDQMLERIRSRIGEQVIELTRRALRDLADSDLQARYVEAFAGRIEGLASDERDELGRWVAEDGKPSVVSASELDDEQREQLRTLVRELAGDDVEPAFRRDAGLVGGIEIQASGRAFGWTVDGYLERAEESMREIMSRDREATEAAGAAAG